MNGKNVTIEDLDATQPMLSTSSPSQIDTGTPLRRISSLSSLTNVSPIDLTQSSPEERVSPEEKRGRFQTSPDRRHSSSLSRLWPRDFSDKNSSGVTNSENVDLDNSNDLEDPDTMPLLQKEPLRICERAAHIMAFDTDSLGDKICQKVPQVCPGKTATYLVDLNKLGHPDDISRDVYGSWGHMSCENYYYSLDKQSKSVRKLNFGRPRKMEEGAKPDMKIRRRFQKHPKTNGQFRKSIFIAFFGENVNVPKWAIVSYEWLCPPFDFLNKAHGNSKDQTKPFQPTAKSVINRMWHSMTWRQKMFRLEPLFLLELPKAQGDISSQNVKENDDFSKANVEIAGILHEKCGEICKNAAIFTHEKLVNQNHMNKNVFGIFDGLDSISVNRTDEYTFICGKPGRQNSSCKTFRDLGVKVCQHTLAVADFLEIRPAYEDFIQARMASMTTTEYIESHVKDKAGDKPRTNKRRIGGGASQKTHSTVVVRTNPGTPAQLMAAAQAQTRSVLPKLSNGSKDKPTPAQRAKLFERKEIVCTERWHNKNKFELMFTEDWFNTQSKARLCWSCKKYIDKAAPPDDMVLVHMERFWIHPPESKWSAPGNMQNRITHARYSCVIAKYPYFTPDLLEATIEVKDKLTPYHERYLADHLGVDFLNH